MEVLHRSPFLSSLSPQTSVAIISRVFGVCKSFLRSLPRRASLTSDSLWAMRDSAASDPIINELLTSLDPFYSSISASPVFMKADLLSLPDKAGTANLADLLPPDALSCLTPSRIFKPPDAPRERVRVSTKGVSRPEYRKAVGRFLQIGMVRLLTSAKCVNGFFSVPKKEAQRPIADAREANEECQTPPKVDSLPGLDVLGALEFDADAVYWLAKLDVDN